MKPLDTNYLLLQFKVKIYSKNGTEFQTFFEDITEQVHPSFKRVPSGGGDDGNDGWIKEIGRYYQVYSPNTPAVKDSEAAKKLTDDFNKLMDTWDEISKIREYYFVFNDKYFGAQKPEKAIAELEKSYPEIYFRTYLARDLEKDFLELTETQMLSIGFNVDTIQSFKMANDILNRIETEIDRENLSAANKMLQDNKDHIKGVNDQKLFLEYSLLEAKYLNRTNKKKEAKNKYEEIAKLHKEDPRALLYIGEYYLHENNIPKNELYIQKARKINDDYWLLDLEVLFRRHHLKENIDLANIDEDTFPIGKKERALFYRFFALLLDKAGNREKSDLYIENAFKCNPNWFHCYIVKLSIIESRMLTSSGDAQSKFALKLLDEISSTIKKFSEFGDIRDKNKALLHTLSFESYFILKDFKKAQETAKDAIELILKCEFDEQIEQLINIILKKVSLPEDAFDKFIKYIDSIELKLSNELNKTLLHQLVLSEKLFREGPKLFEKYKNQKYIKLLENLRKKESQKAFTCLEDDINLVIVIANSLEVHHEVREYFLDHLPNDSDIQKDKMLILFYTDQKKYDEAFELFKKFDIDDFNYLECRTLLKVAQAKKAYDVIILIVDKLLKNEDDKKIIFDLKTVKFEALFSLHDYVHAIDLGEKLLKEDKNNNYLNKEMNEILLGKTIQACFQRAKIDSSVLQQCLELYEKYELEDPTFEFKIGIGAETYILNNQSEKALKEIYDAVKAKKILTPEEYGKLYFFVFIRIGNEVELDLRPLTTTQDNCFIKPKESNRWYFIGNDNPLDALQIKKSNYKYDQIINKNIGDKILFEEKYSSKKTEFTIDIIYNIDSYILWQTKENFTQLTAASDLEGVLMVETPIVDGETNFDNIKNFLKDLQEDTQPLFEIYCKNNNVPLAVLALNEGGFSSAVGRIQEEERGFINFSSGNQDELKSQTDIANEIIKFNKPFYIDSTSALFLSEIGLFQKIYKYINNVIVTQTTIKFLSNIADKFKYENVRSGSLGYSKGKLRFSELDKETADRIFGNFVGAIKLLESKPDNITVISSALKAECFSERKIPPEFCDSCILAQKDNIPILTEDYLYLQMNRAETQKTIPDYFSSYALIKSLYTHGKVPFHEYLDFFGYLSTYRFRFLQFDSDDLERAVFGDSTIKNIKPVNIAKFNFKLTLSEEYGVSFHNAISVVGNFFIRVLLDNTVTIPTVEKIFFEIIESFPTKIGKWDFSNLFLNICTEAIEQNQPYIIIDTRKEIIDRKIKSLTQVAQTYRSQKKIWKPSQTERVVE